MGLALGHCAVCEVDGSADNFALGAPYMGAGYGQETEWQLSITTKTLILS